MKHKLLYLTGIAEQPNTIGQEKLKKATDKSLPQINYESLGIIAPKGEVELDEYGDVILGDDDFEYVETECIINLNNYLGCVDDLEFGSRIYTTSGIAFRVLETCEEVATYIEYVQMSWLERNFYAYKSFFRRNNIKTQQNG